MIITGAIRYIALLGDSEDVVDTEDKPEAADDDAIKPEQDEAEEETTADQQPETIAEQSGEEDTEVTDQTEDQ